MQKVYKIADNILSPLGRTTKQNYQAVRSGRCSLTRYEHYWDMPEPFCASLFSTDDGNILAIDGLTRFESLVVRSVRQALEGINIDVSDRRVVFLLSTTKANVGLLASETSAPGVLYPGESSRRICANLGITTPPIVVCNACISGLSAIILGTRLLQTHQYDHAIICGADELSEFVVSGFQSLKALSVSPCRPFDMERTGLNLGEAAATMVLSTHRPPTPRAWQICRGSMHNDAYHISAPSKRGDGALLCLTDVTTGIDGERLAFINAHGTATLFNDQMESVAIERAGLEPTPVNALKGYFGHTLGAAGVMETLLSMSALDDHLLLGTLGFEELGVSGRLDLSAASRPIEPSCFVKMISGFGGSNGALLAFSEEEGASSNDEEGASGCEEGRAMTDEGVVTHEIHIHPHGVRIDREDIACPFEGKALLTWLYKTYVGDYPKFYKMDMLSRLGFLAAEMLVRSEAETGEDGDPLRAIVLFNHSSSVNADRQYQATIQNKEDYYPSPSLFVYTLPNIVTGEIAIRHHYQGETTFYILAERNERVMREVVAATFIHPTTKSMIAGWLDFADDKHFDARLQIIRKTH